MNFEPSKQQKKSTFPRLYIYVSVHSVLFSVNFFSLNKLACMKVALCHLRKFLKSRDSGRSERSDRSASRLCKIQLLVITRFIETDILLLLHLIYTSPWIKFTAKCLNSAPSGIFSCSWLLFPFQLGDVTSFMSHNSNKLNLRGTRLCRRLRT